MGSILDRRAWLKTAGTAGLGALLYPFEQSGGQTANAARKSANTNEPVKLSSNENPYGPSAAARKAMIDEMDACCRYPWGSHAALIRDLAQKHGVTEEHIVLCAGSNEGLRATALIYGGPQQEIVAPTPTYLALLTYAEQLNTYVHNVPLDDKLQHNLDAMAQRITRRTSMVFVCNPNNPTGSLLPPAAFRDFCDSISKETVIFSDEAYFDYIQEANYPSMIELVKQDKNVIVSRTFSKVYGMAGIRAGYLITRPDIARRIKSVVMASMNVLAVAAARASLQDKEFYQFSLDKNKEALNYMYKIFKEHGLQYERSHANFVFVKTGKDVRTFNDAMRKEGVITGRPFAPLNDWCRISTSTMEDMEVFGRAFTKVMAS